MKSIIEKLIVSAFCLTLSFGVFAQAIFNNNGAKIYIKQGAEVYIKTNSVNNLGLIDNAGLLEIEGDFINNDTATGGGLAGFYRVQRHWENNASFLPDQSEVELYGAAQNITGTAITGFYDLTLSGSGIKTQTIDAEVSDLLSLNHLELATNEYRMLVTNTDPGAITRTTGFISSLDGGRLSRSTDRQQPYIFPTGSSVGTLRYRPLEITPNTINSHTFGARLANVDATPEGFDRTAKKDSILEINPNYYHRIYRSNGADPADIVFFYDSTQDGQWDGTGHWQNLPQWEKIPSSAGNSAPFVSYTVSSWDDFSTPAFALIRFTDLGLTDTTICLNIKAFLSGPYNIGNGLMSDDLRQNGFLPTTEPYSSMGFIQVSPGGNETVDPAIFADAGDSAIVDWVLIELRDKNDINNIVATRSALIQRNGEVVDTNGTSNVKVPGLPFDKYYVALRHRNHFGVIMKDSIFLDNTATAIDFTLLSTTTYGSNAQDTKGGKKVMWSGNTLLDNVIKYSGINNDRDPILTRIGGSIPTNVVLGYYSEDVSMDGIVKYSGSNNDRDIILQNIGGVVPTAVIVEQIP